MREENHGGMEREGGMGLILLWPQATQARGHHSVVKQLPTSRREFSGLQKWPVIPGAVRTFVCT